MSIFFFGVLLFNNFSLKIAFLALTAFIIEKIIIAFSHSGEVENCSTLFLYLSHREVREASSICNIFSAILFREFSKLFIVKIITLVGNKVNLKAFYLIEICSVRSNCL